MTLPVWGQQQKAQDNNQTIDQAIAAAIAVHEADDTAHLGTGESLEAHKTESVIDHPVGCLLPDKISFSDLSFDTTFEAITGFTTVGNVSNSSWPGAILSVDDGGTETSSIKANALGILTGSTLTYNVLFDYYFYADTVGTTAIVNFGIVNNAMTTWYVGFRLTGGNVIGFARWGGTEYTTGTLATPSAGSLVFVRVYYDYVADTIYFYVDGVEEATLSPASAVQISNQFGVKAQANGEESGVFRIFRTTLSRSI